MLDVSDFIQSQNEMLRWLTVTPFCLRQLVCARIIKAMYQYFEEFVSDQNNATHNSNQLAFSILTFCILLRFNGPSLWQRLQVTLTLTWISPLFSVRYPPSLSSNSLHCRLTWIFIAVAYKQQPRVNNFTWLQRRRTACARLQYGHLRVFQYRLGLYFLLMTLQ